MDQTAQSTSTVAPFTLYRNAPSPHFIKCIERPADGDRLVLDAKGKVLKASSWRVELTALSRTQNLYFVASRPGATVHVYQPRYINQTLGRPVLCLRHQPSSEGLRGYINPNDPHSINRLHIDYLGRKEILLTASDDGDIVGYYISGIMAAIETLESGENTEGFPDVKPFFRINVEKSAWGLAVHRQARLIAISANSHKVTVVAFKLATGAIKNPYYVSDRRTGYSVRTLQAGDNVPSISFNNTGTDPSGRWLVGNVIDGSTGLWDLHRDERRTLFLGHCILTPKGNDNSQHPHCETYSHSTWGAIFVDPRWCHFSKSKREAFGGRPRWRDDNIWDTTVSVLQEESGSVNHLFAEPWKYINHGMYPYFMSSNNSDVDESSVVPIHNQHKLCTAGNYGDGEDNFFDVIRNTENVRVPIMPSQFVSNPNGFYANPTLNASPTSIPDDINTEGSNGNNSELPPMAIFTKSEIYMLQPNDILCAVGGQSFGPVIAMYKPCESCFMAFDSYYTSIPGFLQNRLNLSIPELGLFIVSDKNICAVFSITVNRDRRNGQERDIYGFRREYILPFQEGNLVPQVNLGSEPGERIMGIAAAPLQGEMDRTSNDGEVDEDWDGYVGNARTWRLFLYMVDGDLLVYELSRAKTGWKPPGVELII